VGGVDGTGGGGAKREKRGEKGETKKRVRVEVEKKIGGRKKGKRKNNRSLSLVRTPLSRAKVSAPAMRPTLRSPLSPVYSAPERERERELARQQRRSSSIQREERRATAIALLLVCPWFNRVSLPLSYLAVQELLGHSGSKAIVRVVVGALALAGARGVGARGEQTPRRRRRGADNDARSRRRRRSRGGGRGRGGAGEGARCEGAQHLSRSSTDGAAKERRSRRGTSAEVSFLKRKSGSGRDVSSENLPCPLLPARPLSSLETQTRRREERGGFFRSLALRPPSDTRSAVSFSSSAETEMPPRRSSRRGAVGGEHTGGGRKALRGQGETSHKALLFFPRP